MIKLGTETVDGLATYQDGGVTVTFESDASFSALEELYGTPGTVEVQIADDAQFYYVRELISMSRHGDEVSLCYAVSALSPNAEENLKASQEGSDLAILDLAELVADHEARVAALEERLEAIEAAGEKEGGEG